MNKDSADLKDTDFLKEFRDLGADIKITHGRNYSFVYNIMVDDEVIIPIQVGQLSYQPNKDVNFFKNYDKKELEHQLETNSHFMPKKVRDELNDVLDGWKKQHNAIENILNLYNRLEAIPVLSAEELIMAKMNKINDTNNGLIEEFNDYHQNNELIEKITNMGFYSEKVNGDDLNQIFSTKRFNDQDYYKLPLAFDSGSQSYLLIREQQDPKAFVGAIITYQDGLHTLSTFKPVQRLDYENLERALKNVGEGLKYEKEPTELVAPEEENGTKITQEKSLEAKRKVKLKIR